MNLQALAAMDDCEHATGKPLEGHMGADMPVCVVRLRPDELAALDEWRRQQPVPPTRPEALRQMVELVTKFRPLWPTL